MKTRKHIFEIEYDKTGGIDIRIVSNIICDGDEQNLDQTIELNSSPNISFSANVWDAFSPENLRKWADELEKKMTIK